MGDTSLVKMLEIFGDLMQRTYLLAISCDPETQKIFAELKKVRKISL